jgi:hypothetical protein
MLPGMKPGGTVLAGPTIRFTSLVVLKSIVAPLPAASDPFTSAGTVLKEPERAPL